MKRLAISGLIALAVLLALACSLTSGIPTEQVRRRAIAVLGDEVEDEVVRDFIVVTPPPTFTATPTPLACIKPVSSGTYYLSVFNDQSGAADNPQYAYGPPDGQDTRWEGNSDVTRYWSYSLPSVISGMITHTLVYTPHGTVTSVDLYVHRERFVSVDDPGWVQVCSGRWNCSFSSEVGSVMYALSGAGGVQVDGAMVELTNGCEYSNGEVIAAANTPTLTPTSTPTATIESSSESPPPAPPDEAPTEAPTDSATPVPPIAASPTLPPFPTFPPSPTLPPPSPTLPPPSPTLPPPSPTLPPTLPPPSPTSPPSSPPTDTPTDTPTPTPVPPVVAFSAASYSIAENGGAATITVVLNKASSQTVTVLYTTIDGTAVAGSEYTATSGTLTFNPGQTSQSFTVSIINDLVIGEGNLVANLTLSNPTNATLGTPNPATLTMVDTCTLPDAITAANTDTATGGCAAGNGDDTITILLTGAINLTAVLPDLSSNIIIDGPGAANLTIQRSSGGNYRIFTVTAGNTVTINDVTMSNGVADGGGIFNDGVLTLNNSVVSGNTSPANGGGITNPGTLTVNNSTISGNSASAVSGAGGGGIYNPGGSVTINNSTISGNTADDDGGGISNLGGTLMVNNSTIDNNSSIGSGLGGGIYNDINGVVTVSNSTLSNNDTTGGSIDQGGGIYNEGGFTVDNSIISGNSANSSGGIINLGTLTINDSLIDGNTANVGGGGITNRGLLTINRSTISNNVAGTRSGGISNESGTTTLIDSTVNNNSAGIEQAGGLRNGNNPAATMLIVNSTISNNNAGNSGGGLYIWSGRVTFINSTITGNTTPTRGGGIRDDLAGAGTVVVQNTIVAGNSAGIGPDCEANNLTSQDFNLIQDTANCTIVGITTNNITGLDPLLGPLQNNGGPTNTHALSGVSPAIDAGSCPSTTADQRGLTRPVDKTPPNADDGCDIGAFEVQ